MPYTQKRVQLFKIGCKFITYLSHNEEVLAFFYSQEQKKQKKAELLHKKKCYRTYAFHSTP